VVEDVEKIRPRLQRKSRFRAILEIVIERVPAIRDILPIAIPPFELTFEPDLLRRDQAEGGIVDLEIARNS
jgi:hypothetical protein